MSHVKYEFHSNLDTLTYFTAKNRSKSFICIHGLKSYIEASDLVHTLKWWVSWPLMIFVMLGQFLALWWTKTLKRGELVELQPATREVWVSSQSGLCLWRVFWIFSNRNVLSYQPESLFIHWVGCTTYWVHVSLEWDPCDLHILSLGTVN